MNKTSQNTLPIGYILCSQLYNYRIEKVLGQGTFGITYLANVELKGGLGKLQSNMQVAIKEFFMQEVNGRSDASVTSSSDSNGNLFTEYMAKFLREATNLSKLKHLHIVDVLEYFEANNTCYYVMAYLPNGDLDSEIKKRGGLPEEDVLKYTHQMADALMFMHQNRMLHLDLKPKNVMLDAQGEAVLIDFGLSKQYDEKGEPESSTTVGRGTPGYAPLEQTYYQEGAGLPVTMDVYALGATMYKMLLGESPCEASVILNEGFPVSMLKGKSVSPWLISVIKKAMAPIKKDRYQSVQELKQALENKTLEEEEYTTLDSDETDYMEVTVVNDPIDNEDKIPLQPESEKDGVGPRRINMPVIVTYVLMMLFYTPLVFIPSASFFKLWLNRGLPSKAEDYIPCLFIGMGLYAYVGLCSLIFKKKKAGFWMVGQGVHLLFVIITFFCILISIGKDDDDTTWIGLLAIIIALLFFSSVLTMASQFLFHKILNNKCDGLSEWERLNEDGGWFWKCRFQQYVHVAMLVIPLVICLVSMCTEWYHSSNNTDDELTTIPYDEAAIGDFFYSDGTISHEQDYTKDCIGIVFSLEVSETERADGFTHGEIVALQDANGGKKCAWGSSLFDTEAPNYTNENNSAVMQAKSDRDGYFYVNAGAGVGAETASRAAQAYVIQPCSAISSWYLPTAGQWIKIIENLGGSKVSDDIFMQFDATQVATNLQQIQIDPKKWYWANTEYNGSHAWSVRINDGHISSATNKEADGAYVRAVAAF